MKRQDLNGVRTPQDVERRHNLGAIPKLEEEVSEFSVDENLSSSSTHPVQNKIITQALNILNTTKVDKVAGKGLSTNDYTNEDKAKSHYHDNKSILDGITQSKIDQWDGSSNSQIYSYSEKVVGEWIDGKPLYRKMIDYGSLPANSIDYKPHNISDIKHVHVNLGGTVWCANNQSYDSGGMHSPIHEWFSDIEVDSINITIRTTDNDASNWHMLVCLEYTKTTD